MQDQFQGAKPWRRRTPSRAERALCPGSCQSSPGIGCYLISRPCINYRGHGRYGSFFTQCGSHRPSLTQAGRHCGSLISGCAPAGLCWGVAHPAPDSSRFAISNSSIRTIVRFMSCSPDFDFRTYAAWEQSAMSDSAILLTPGAPWRRRTAGTAGRRTARRAPAQRSFRTGGRRTCHSVRRPKDPACVRAPGRRRPCRGLCRLRRRLGPNRDLVGTVLFHRLVA